ncbi:MAG: hypothetical protein RIS82_1170 [Actinomycetota bacterium]
MIASLRGVCAQVSQSQCILDVAGVGYLVAITPQTSSQLRAGAESLLLTSMIVREDAMQLYGFISEDERALFELLRSVSGVGPKSALAVLSGLSASEIINAINTDNDSTFKAISGIGPKTAKLICVTLNGKVGQAESQPAVRPQSALADEILEALIGLGWQAKLAEPVIAKSLASNPQISRGELLKTALAELGHGKSVGA